MKSTAISCGVSGAEPTTLKTGVGWGAKDGAGHELGEPKACVFVMLNPSTADGQVDDPTIRRCVGFAKLRRYERLEVLNLFAYRVTKPSDLMALDHGDDPAGPSNKHHFDRVISDAGIIVCAWGSHGNYFGQDETTLGWIDARGRKCYSLGATKDGHPKHPLYLPATAKLVPFDGFAAKILKNGRQS